MYNQSVIFGIDSDIRNQSYLQVTVLLWRRYVMKKPNELDPLELVKLVTIMSSYHPFHSIICDLINAVNYFCHNFSSNIIFKILCCTSLYPPPLNLYIYALCGLISDIQPDYTIACITFVN